MIKIVSAALMILAATGAQAETCRQMGVVTSCSNTDGTYSRSYNNIGSTDYGSDGSSYNRRTDTYSSPQGDTERFQQYGNRSYGSQGTRCARVGNQTVCD